MRVRLERRNSLGPFRERELEDPLVLDVLQVLGAEVDDGGAVGNLVAEERAGRLGEQDLAAAPAEQIRAARTTSRPR